MEDPRSFQDISSCRLIPSFPFHPPFFLSLIPLLFLPYLSPLPLLSKPHLHALIAAAQGLTPHSHCNSLTKPSDTIITIIAITLPLLLLHYY